MKYSFNEIFPQSKEKYIANKNVIGIDVGSRQAKAILLSKGTIYTEIIPTGFFMKKTMQELLNSLLKQSGLSVSDIDYIVGTGYGRVAFEFDDIPHKILTEISCHAKGAFVMSDDIHTIIDIGGQDSKVIKVNPDDGTVLDFTMNDKCAAGTGRFLERAANILGMDVTEIGPLSLTANEDESISSQCVVFAESEIVSARAKGIPVANIAAGIHLSVARRVSALLNRVGIEKNVLFTGGVSNNVGMKAALEELFGFPIEVSKLNPVFAGALGAAIYAGEHALKAQSVEAKENKTFQLDLSDLNAAVEKAKEEYIHKTHGKKKNVAYFCNYTPLEILASANVMPIRLFNVANKQEIASGELLTRSVFCDLTKGFIGSFIEGNPLHKSIDKIFTFYTCDCMRKTSEAINNNFVSTTVYNLPRITTDADSRRHYADELRAFRKDVEELTGEKISDDVIRKNIVLYNQARQKMKQISAYRKRKMPLVTGTDFRSIAHSYFYLPIDVLLVQLDKILEQLVNAPEEASTNKPRIMLTGGVLADGDSKITRIIEELGMDIVVEDSCSGYSNFDSILDEQGTDVFDILAKGYFGKVPCVRMTPIDNRIKFAQRMAEEYNVDGIIYYYLKFCPGYGMVKNRFIKQFQEAEIPVMELETNYTADDEGQIRTRVEAFKEVLEEMR